MWLAKKRKKQEKQFQQFGPQLLHSLIYALERATDRRLELAYSLIWFPIPCASYSVSILPGLG